MAEASKRGEREKKQKNDVVGFVALLEQTFRQPKGAGSLDFLPLHSMSQMPEPEGTVR